MAPPAGLHPASTRRDAAWLVFLAVAALVPRLAFLRAFPARPFQDFQVQVNFALAYLDRPFASGYMGWSMFSPGLPLFMAAVLRLVPGPPEDVARYTMAVMTALTALLPFVLWRGVLGLPARVTASLLLALWPGHILFSGVVAQDNGVLPPAIALAALAVRALIRRDEAWPIASVLLFCAAVAVRGEMLLVLVPLLLPAAGLLRPSRQWPRARLAAAGAALALGLFTLGLLRWAGSGEFGLTPPHSGYTAVGAYVPGAGVSWAVPKTYFAATAPELMESESEMLRAGWRVVRKEIRRRPGFHAIRAFASAATSVLRSDVDSLYWSIGFGGAVPDSDRPRVVRFMSRVQGAVARASVVALSLWAGAVVLALRWRNWPILALSAAMVLKIVVHGLLAVQTRYFVVVMAFALLTIALAVEEVPRRPPGWSVAALLIGFALVLGVRVVTQKAEAWVLDHEEQLTYHFTLRDPARVAQLDCEVREGLVALLWAHQARAAIRLLKIEPGAGESATADCQAHASRPAAVEVRVTDAYLEGGFPDRLVQTVTVDGEERLRRDVAAVAGRSWGGVPLGVLQRGQRRRVIVRMTARHPDRGFRWGGVNTEMWIETPAGPR
jgi:hypothetical protein